MKVIQGVVSSGKERRQQMKRTIDITDLAVLANQFPINLAKHGFRVMQNVGENGEDLVRYILPPVVTISAGKFWMGSDPNADPLAKQDEMPQHELILGSFSLAKYPLTVAEYACFIRASSYPSPPNAYTITWQEQLRERQDHPVVSVSWEALQTYGQWLTYHTNTLWRLPTEAEWEKAARGMDQRIYPWGAGWDNTRAQLSRGGMRKTTAVGSYPHGASPYGVQDMIGNVYEWVNSLYKPYPYTTSDDRESLLIEGERVCRGGVWFNRPLDIRLSARTSAAATSEDYLLSGRIAYSHNPD